MALSSKSLAGLKGDYELSSEQPPQPGIHLRLPQEALVAIRRGETQLSFTDGQSPVRTNLLSGNFSFDRRADG